MKKNLLLALIAFGINAKAQINFENTYTSSQLYLTKLTFAGEKYTLVDNQNNQLKI